MCLNIIVFLYLESLCLTELLLVMVMDLQWLITFRKLLSSEREHAELNGLPHRSSPQTSTLTPQNQTALGR